MRKGITEMTLLPAQALGFLETQEAGERELRWAGAGNMILTFSDLGESKD